jgi:membrane protein YdbS with pleckstrin-like domain
MLAGVFSPPPDSAEPLGPEPAPASAGPAAVEAALADGRRRRVDPRFVDLARIGGLIGSGVVLAVGGLGLAFYATGAEPRFARLVLLAGLLGGLVVLLLAAAWLHPPLQYRHLSWRLSSDGLEIRRGVWFRHEIRVPRARVQHTDVERGPIERRFELATLVVHTAGHRDSEIRLEGLEHATALAVRDYLLAPVGSDDGA